MSYPAAIIANKIINLAFKEEREVTPMQVIKLTYLCHAWYLAYKKTPLIHEDVEAWTYGPVIKDLYDNLKHYGRNAVDRPIDISNKPIDQYEEKLIEAVYDSYRKYNGLQLSTLTHQDGTPWDKTRKSYGPGAIIPQDFIEEHFKEKLN